MKTFITPFKVGLLLVIALLAFAYMFGTMSSSVFRDGQGYRVYALLDDATGLSPQSRVMMAGISVGEVEAIALEGQRARVTVRLRRDIELREGIEERTADGQTVWLNGAVLSKKSASLLGDYYLELSPGIDGRVLVDGDRIRNVSMPLSVDDLLVQMNTLAASLQRISGDVEQITGEMRNVFGDPETTSNLLEIIEHVNGMTASLNRITNDNQDSLRTIFRNVEQVSEDVRAFTGRSARSVESILEDVSVVTTELRHIMGASSADVQQGIGTMTGTMASLQLALDNLNYSLANVQEITDRMVDGEGTIGRLLTDDTIAMQTERVVTSAADLIEPIARMQTWIELRSEYGLGERSFKNYVQLSLRPNPNRFYILELVDDPRGSTETTLRTTVSTDPERPGIVYEEVTETRNRFKVSVLLGQRWALARNNQFYLGGRFGIIESSGGIGANAWAFNDALELRMDLFDFGQARRGRLRTYGLLSGRGFFPERSLLSNLFLQGGVDDVLNAGSRNFFVGAGIQFNDRDLRSIVMVAPTPSF